MKLGKTQKQKETQKQRSGVKRGKGPKKTFKPTAQMGNEKDA